MKFSIFFMTFDNLTDNGLTLFFFIDLQKHLTKEIRIKVIFINVVDKKLSKRSQTLIF